MPTAEDFARFKQEQDNFMGQVAKKTITWQRRKYSHDNYGEDTDIAANYDTIELEVLIQYNYFRTWPVSVPTTTGEEDRQNCMVLLNVQYLTDLGYWGDNNQMVFSPGLDRFIIDGITHKVAGDTHFSQNETADLHIALIMKREELPTRENPYE